jgi:putative transposon-encoded protein
MSKNSKLLNAICDQAHEFSKMVNDPNISNEKLDAAFEKLLGRAAKVKVPKKKIRRGIGSY